MPYRSRLTASSPARPVPEHLISGERGRDEERLIGGDTGLAAVMARAQMVSRSTAPVLLFGETGTGKEIIARAIHEHSAFRSGPFVASTAARSRRADRLRAVRARARQRSPAPSQAEGLVRAGRRRDAVPRRDRRARTRRAGRLLRVVQDGRSSASAASGRSASTSASSRRRTATCRRMVEAQTFREDLWYRLAVFPIVIPPLRDRPKDIRAFAEYFAERAANRFGLKPVPVSADDVRVLTVTVARQRARDRGGDGACGRSSARGARSSVAAAIGSSPAGDGGEPVRRERHRPPIAPLDAACAPHRDALDATRGRIEGPHGAARLLRINPHTLRARMRKLKIDWRAFRAPNLG